jgi:hypothetical protein
VESLAGTLAAIHARIPRHHAAGRERLLRASARLPAALTRWIYLESHLGSDEPRVDLIVGIERDEAILLVDGRAALTLGAEPWSTPGWRGVRALCARWLDAGSPLHAGVERIWLEFDLPAGGDAPPVPGVFVDFAARGSSAEERMELIATALAPLLGAPLPPSTAGALLRVLRAMPPGARAAYAGLLLPRGSPAVRLCVADVPRAGLPRFLADAGWPGDAGGLAATLDGLAPSRRGSAHPEPAIVHLDVDGGVHARVGVEYVFTRQGQARGALTEVAFLDYLVASGLCTPAHRAALAAWPGASVEEFPHQPGESVAVRRVNHVKVVCGADGRPLAAKGYAYLHHVPRRRTGRAA